MNALGAERAASAAGWRFVYLLVQGGGSLLLFVLLARLLDGSALAAASLAQGILVLTQAIGDFGLSQAAVTALPASLAREPRRRSELLAGAASTFVIASVAALGLALGATALVPASVRGSVAAIAVGAAATVLVAGADGLLRATGDFRRPIPLVVASRAGAFISLPVAALGGSAGLTCAAISLGTLIGSIPAIRNLQKWIRGGETGSAREFVRAATPLGLSNIVILAGSRVNSLLLGAFNSVRAAAVYEAAWRLYQLGQYALGFAATAWAPLFADAIGAGRAEELRRLSRRALILMSLGGVGASAALIALRRPLTELLFDELGPPAGEAVLSLLLVTPLSLAGLVATYVLSATDRFRRRLLETFTVGAVANLALLTIWIDDGALGAARACAVGLALTNVCLIVSMLSALRDVEHSNATEARVK